MAKRGRPRKKAAQLVEIPRIGRLANLHAYVDEWLIHKNVSDAHLAGRLDTSPANITKWRDKNWRIQIKRIDEIAHALDIKPAWRIFTLPEKDPTEAVREQIRQEFRRELEKAIGGR